MSIVPEKEAHQLEGTALSRASLLVTSLELIDQHGLDAFSLGKLAKAVGISTPSLYHYFTDKADLLSALAREVLLDFGRRPIRRRGGWKDILVAICIDARRTVLRHPKAAPILLMYPPRHIVLDGYERSIGILARDRVPAQDRLRICIALEHLTWGSIFLTASALSRGVAPFPIYDPREFPTVAEAVAANPLGEEAMFISNCHTILSGFDDGPV